VVEVIFELDGAELARLAQAPWAHDVPVDQLLAGSHQVRVTARDGAGHTANATGSFTVPESGVPGDPIEPIVDGCGCGGPGASALGGLALLALALGRRRRS
jgi:uncharacterized protein (TIGR03382 family)